MSFSIILANTSSDVEAVITINYENTWNYAYSPSNINTVTDSGSTSKTRKINTGKRDNFHFDTWAIVLMDELGQEINYEVRIEWYQGGVKLADWIKKGKTQKDKLVLKFEDTGRYVA